MVESHPGLLRFGRGVRAARRDQALTRRQLAERTGLSLAQISAIEQGVGDPNMTELEAIATVLDREVWSLFK